MKNFKSFDFLLMLLLVQNLFFQTELFSQEMPLARKLLVDNTNFSVVQGADDKLKEAIAVINKMTEDTYQRSLATNLVFITAAELALVGSIDEHGSLKLPVKISPKEILVGYLKCDTIDGRGCTTLSRIKDGKLLPSDIFTFTADLDKVGTLMPRENILSTFQGIQNIANFTNSYTEYRRKLPNSTLTARIIETKYLKIEAFLWFLRASFVTSKKPKEIEEQSSKLLKELNLR